MLQNDFKSMLKEFVVLKSISTDDAFKSEINKTVTWLENKFKGCGFTTEIWNGSNSNPVVFATYNLGSKGSSEQSDTKTVLVYGHYDVQPAAIEDGWNSEPFELVEKDGRLIARGVVDNKGQILTHIYTVKKLISENRLKCNVKFLIEGNEETSNDDLGDLIAENKEKLVCDYILVSDGEIPNGTPAIEYSLRGGFNTKLTYKTAKTNLHSGIFGGAVPNAAQELTKFLSSLYDQASNITIPGFYEAIDEISPDQKQDNEKIVAAIPNINDLAGTKTLTLNKGEDLYTKTGLMPTIQITGIKSGYIGEGYANIVPNTAEARINFRTVSAQDNQKILNNFKELIAKNTPDYVDYEFSNTTPYNWIKVDIKSDIVKKVKKLLKEAYNLEPLTKPVGGGIPVVSDFKEILGKDTLLVSLGNDDCNMHGSNENYRIDLAEKGLKFSELFFTSEL